MPAAHPQHHDRPEDQAREHRVQVCTKRESVRQQRPDARQLCLAVHDLVPDRVLHPRVRDQDEVPRCPGAERHDPDGCQVDARREPVPTEDPEAEEGRLEEERRQSLDGQRRTEHVADEPRVHRPVHPELEFLDEPGGDRDRDVDQQERPEEAGQAQPGLVPGAVPDRLHDRHQRRQTESQRYEEEVVDRRRRELHPREVDGRGCDGHVLGLPRYSLSTVIRPTRWWVNVAPAQSTTAFARSSFVGSSARCTVPHATCAFLPVMLRPPSIWTTAAPRPIVAIVPLSLYLNGFVSLPAIRRAIVSPACSPDCKATEPSWGRTCSVLASTIAAASPST